MYPFYTWQCRRAAAEDSNESSTTENPQLKAISLTEEPVQTYRSAMRQPTGTADRPRREYNDQLCLTVYVTINGVRAYTLFDSGSTTDSVSPDFTRIAKLDVLELSSLVTLQLGCVSSRSKINYGTKANTRFGPLSYYNMYYNIANLDKYDAILGTPFMRHHKIALDLATDAIIIDGKHRLSALSRGEGSLMAKPIPLRKYPE